MRRSKVLAVLKRLDPERDCQLIVSLLATYDFPFELLRGVELGFFKAYCVPAMAQLLDATRQIYDRTQARYETSVYSLLALMEHGLTSDGAREVVRHMNRMHGFYNIAPRHARYALATVALECIRAIDRYGWRKLQPEERLALFFYHRDVAALIHVAYFDSLDELECFHDDYEDTEFAYSVEGRRLADVTTASFVSKFPKPLAPILRQFALASLGPKARAACGLPAPNPVAQRFVRALLRLRAIGVRLGPTPTDPRGQSAQPHPFYTAGFDPARLAAFQHKAAVPPHVQAR